MMHMYTHTMSAGGGGGGGGGEGHGQVHPKRFPHRGYPMIIYTHSIHLPTYMVTYIHVHVHCHRFLAMGGHATNAH